MQDNEVVFEPVLPGTTLRRAPMIRDSLSHVLLLGIALFMLALAPESAFARGGHGGGGFHGGGFQGSGYHGNWGGNRGWGGYRGGWGRGSRGGWGGYGWRGGWGGWGCCGWGFGISFNFGWPGWGWGYPVYAPGYVYVPYPDYYYSPYDPYYYYSPANASANYAGPDAQVDVEYVQSGDSYAESASYRQARQYRAPVTRPQRYSVRPAPSSNSLRLYEANYVTRPAMAATSVRTPASYRASASLRRLPAARPEVHNVIRAVRAMPPDAAQRALESGRFSNLSPDELRLVRQAAGLPSS